MEARLYFIGANGEKVVDFTETQRRINEVKSLACGLYLYSIFTIILLLCLYGCSTGKLLEQRNLHIKEGLITDNETWSGNIRIIGDVIVPENVILTVKPGTNIVFSAKDNGEKGLKLTIYGILLAEGNSAKPIMFKSDSSKSPRASTAKPQWWRNSSWRGVIISAKNTSLKSILKNCIIDNAHIGIDAKSPVEIEGCLIKRCEKSNIECSSELWLRNSKLVDGQCGLSGRISKLIFDNNSIINHQFGTMCYINHGRIFASDFGQCASGMMIEAIGDYLEISKNSIKKCAPNGIELVLRKSDVSIIDNEFNDCYYGLSVKGEGNIVLNKNRLKKGMYGIYIQKESKITIYGSINSQELKETNTITHMAYGNIYPYEYILKPNE
jgi:hypothetical protein